MLSKLFFLWVIFFKQGWSLLHFAFFPECLHFLLYLRSILLNKSSSKPYTVGFSWDKVKTTAFLCIFNVSWGSTGWHTGTYHSSYCFLWLFFPKTLLDLRLEVSRNGSRTAFGFENCWCFHSKLLAVAAHHQNESSTWNASSLKPKLMFTICPGLRSLVNLQSSHPGSCLDIPKRIILNLRLTKLI